MRNVYRGKSGVNKSNCKSGKCVGGDQATSWGTIGGYRCFGPKTCDACITAYSGISGDGICVVHYPNQWARARYYDDQGVTRQLTSTQITEDGVCPKADTSCMKFLVGGWNANITGVTTLTFTSICPSTL